MDLAAIGSAGIAWQLAQLQESIGVAMLKKAMDSQQLAAALPEQMLPAGFGHAFDIRV